MIGLSGTWSLPSLIVIFSPPSGTLNCVYAIFFVLLWIDRGLYQIALDVGEKFPEFVAQYP
jgi:hypothetical protein